MFPTGKKVCSENENSFALTKSSIIFFYYSTDAVFPTGKKDCSEDENIDDYHPDLNDGYSQSKWVAEQLITRAGQKGLPVVIYRLGTIYFIGNF